MDFVPARSPEPAPEWSHARPLGAKDFFFSVAGFAQHRARHHTDIKGLNHRWPKDALPRHALVFGAQALVIRSDPTAATIYRFGTSDR